MKLAVTFALICAVGIGLAIFRVVSARSDAPPAPPAARHELANDKPVVAGPPSAAEDAGEAPSPARVTQPAVSALSEPPEELQSEPGALTTVPAPRPAATAPVTNMEQCEQPTGADPSSAVHWAPESDSPAALRRLAAAREALAVDPYHPRALRDELAALHALGRWAEAERTMKKLTEAEPDNIELRLDYARQLVRQGLWNQAIDPLQQILERQPDNLVAWSLLAAAQHTNGRLDDARRSWTRVIELAPEDPAAYANRGQVYAALHEWPAAAIDLERSCALDPNRADTSLALAQVYSELGRHEDARVRALHVLERNPRNVRAMNRLAELAWYTSRADPAGAQAAQAEALQWWRRSLAIDPDQPAIRARLEAAEHGPG